MTVYKLLLSSCLEQCGKQPEKNSPRSGFSLSCFDSRFPVINPALSTKQWEDDLPISINRMPCELRVKHLWGNPCEQWLNSTTIHVFCFWETSCLQSGCIANWVHHNLCGLNNYHQAWHLLRQYSSTRSPWRCRGISYSYIFWGKNTFKTLIKTQNILPASSIIAQTELKSYNTSSVIRHFNSMCREIHFRMSPPMTSLINPTHISKVLAACLIGKIPPCEIVR